MLAVFLVSFLSFLFLFFLSFFFFFSFPLATPHSFCIQTLASSPGAGYLPPSNYGFSQTSGRVNRPEEKPRAAGDRRSVLGLGHHLRLHQPPPEAQSQGEGTSPGAGGGGGWGDGKLPAERSWRLCGLSAPRTVRAAPRSGAEKRGGTAPVQPENVSDGAFCGRHSGTRNTRNFVAAPGSGARVSQSCAGGERGRPSPRGAGTQ